MSENYKLIEDLARKDALGLVAKGKAYGDSWKKRGGVGAFMMLARKWDRIENVCRAEGYDIFKAAAEDISDIIDDIEDLRRYLLLVQAHVESEIRKGPTGSDKVHGTVVRPNQCAKCGAPGNHAGMPCPRELDAQRQARGEPTAYGYVDQDNPHDPYGRT